MNCPYQRFHTSIQQHRLFYIDEQHLAEFKASAIADDIAVLNFRSWIPDNENDLDEVFTLLIIEPEHRNNGTLSGSSPQIFR